MDLLGSHPGLDLYDPEWRIYSRTAPNPPHFIGAAASVRNSLVTEGCAVDGTVENCVLSPGVRVERGATVRDSVLMSGVTVKAGANVSRSIVDSGATVRGGDVVGLADGISVFSGTAAPTAAPGTVHSRHAPSPNSGKTAVAARAGGGVTG